MSSQVTVDDVLLHQAREVSGPMSDRELVELGLRALIHAKPTAPEERQTDVDPNDRQNDRPQNPLLALLDSDFVGSADSDRVDLSETWKSELTAILGAKHDHR
jgi:Arc/MetJ family transcription regulator